MKKLRTYYTDLVDRAVRSAAHGALLAIGGDQANVLELDASVLLGFAGGAALLSVLTTLAAGGLTGRTGIEG